MAPCGACDRRELVGALEEKRFFDRIMFEHAKFVRSGVDPTEEATFQTANQFAASIEALWVRVMMTDPGVPEAEIRALIDENFERVGPERDFLRNATEEVRACRLLAILPAELLEHLALETVFFLGILQHVSRMPTPSRGDLLLPGPNVPVLLAPRHAFSCYPQGLNELAFEYGMFWTRRHKEHADVLQLYFRPGQEAYRQNLAVFSMRFDELLTAGQSAFQAAGVLFDGANVSTLSPVVFAWIQDVVTVTRAFRDYMMNVVMQLVTCTIPTGQADFWPLLGDHIRREADYTIDALTRIVNASQGVIEPDLFPEPRPWEKDWRMLM